MRVVQDRQAYRGNRLAVFLGKRLESLTVRPRDRLLVVGLWLETA
jgi:hypothetical protein